MIKLLILLALFSLYAIVLSAAAPASFFLIVSSFDASKGYVYGSQINDLAIGCLLGWLSIVVFTRLNRLRKYWVKQQDQ